jgi:hypothetical protein
MSGRAILISFASALLLAGSIVGCGGSESDSSTGGGAETTTTALSGKKMVKRAVAICASSKLERNKRAETVNGWVKEGEEISKPLQEKILRYVRIVPAENVSQELRRLVSSGEADGQLEEFVDALETDVESAKAKPLELTTGAGFRTSGEIANSAGQLSECVQ